MILLQTTKHWTAIDWVRAEEHVAHLQKLISEAHLAGNFRLRDHLIQHLTRTFAARALAVRTVLNNQGSKTPGVDGVVWTTELAMQAVEALKNAIPGKYKASPVRRVNIPKANNPSATRPLGIPTMFDRAVQALYNLALLPIAEAIADKNSHGFRKNRSTQTAVDAVSGHLRSRTVVGLKAYEGDIQSFFNEISHEWILNNIPLPRQILLEFLKAGYVTNGKKHPTEAGVPQGGIISPTIANMVLDGLEAMLRDALANKAKCRNFVRDDFIVIRYADDFVIIGSGKSSINWVWKIVLSELNKFLAERGVSLHPVKSKMTDINNTEGIDFLGFNIRVIKTDSKKQVRVTPASKNIKNLISKIRDLLKLENTSISVGDMINKLNEILRGWANYYSLVASSDTFYKIERIVRIMFINWLKKKYPRISYKTMLSIHFTRVDETNTFIPSGVILKNDKKVKVTLFRMTSISMNTAAIKERREKILANREKKQNETGATKKPIQAGVIKKSNQTVGINNISQTEATKKPNQDAVSLFRAALAKRKLMKK